MTATPENSSAESHVSVEGLRITYRTGPYSETEAVAFVDFRLARGDRLGIVGESGCGKSTLIRALMGHVRPGARFAAGRVMVAGRDILRLPERELRRYRGGQAALVPQNPLSSLTPHLTVGAQLVELLLLHAGLSGRTAREQALTLMASTGLPDPASLFSRYPHELSGGQRQRLVIAAALVGTPELILLDEPTTALDKTVETQVLDLVSEIQSQLQTTLVYVSHDLNVISRMCSRVLVMEDGCIVEDGLVKAVFSKPSNAYTRTLIQAIPKLEPRCAEPASAQAEIGRPKEILHLHRLCFSYEPQSPRVLSWFHRAPKPPPTLHDISFEIPAGTTLGVVGESGSGKSTLASLIAGALSGHQGKMLFRGQPLAGVAVKRPQDLRRRVQMIYQDPLSSLNPQHSVEEIVGRPLRLFTGLTNAAVRERVQAMLSELELSPDLLRRTPRQLSGGQQQRVAIARAFICEPDLVLCDEITSALDVTVQAQVLEMMTRLQRERGTSYLFISHNLTVAAQMSHRLLVLQRGRVMDYAPTWQLIASGGSTYTRTLLGAFIGACNSPTNKAKTDA